MTSETRPVEAENKKTGSTKTTEAAKKVRALVKANYLAAQQAKAQGKLVAYTMAVSVYDEILRAMDVVPVYTENFAGVCAAKRMAEEYILKAEADGYSNLICGYVRVGLGFDAMRKDLGHMPENAPDGGMPKPDLLLGSSAACDPRFKWYQALGRYMDAPIFCHDVMMPPLDVDASEAQGYYVSYLTSQLRGVVEFLERKSGKKLDPERLWEAIKLSDEADALRWDAYQLRKAIPCPMPSEDHFSIMVPALFLRGTIEARDFFRDLLAELRHRVSNKLGSIPDEKMRFIWGGGLPPWHTMWIYNYFGSLGAVFVAETSYRPFEIVQVPVSVKDPVEYLATRHYLRETIRYAKAKRNSGHSDVEFLLELVEGYSADGMVMHVSRSCRASSVGQLNKKYLVNKHLPVPTLQLTSDVVDVRDYSEADWKMRIDAFVETVAARNAGRRTSK